MFILIALVDVIGEDCILKWYRDGHSSKGKSVFLGQMKKFVEWLENAEEGVLYGFTILYYTENEMCGLYCLILSNLVTYGKLNKPNV